MISSGKPVVVREINVLVFAVIFMSLFLPVCFADDIESLKTLVYKLSTEEGNHSAAAIELRRLAMMAEEPLEKAGYNYGAAFEYFLFEDYQLTEKMLSKIDQSAGFTQEIQLLRAEAAARDLKIDVAVTFMDHLVKTSRNSDIVFFATNSMASLFFQKDEPEKAEQILLNSERKNQRGLSAIEKYKGKKKKSPSMGGLLGLLPGMGYAYSGEYLNGLRSFLLNSVFIFGMADTANDKNWGAFSVITFFELTWYSGSVFGGMDAAYRYNRVLIEDTIDEINGHQQFQLDLEKLPLVSLSFEF